MVLDLKEEFRTKYIHFLENYTAAKEAGGATLTNFARGSEGIVAELYALKSEADPTLFKEFKEIADVGLAWETGCPATAVRNYSRHKELASWEENGSELVFHLLSDDETPQPCNKNLRTKIQDDIKKMMGSDFKDEYLGGGDPPTYVKIPAPQSQTLKARLIGSTVAEHGFSGAPIPPSLIKKVGTDPLFNAWDDYQKKILKAADSPEAMGAAFCELSLLLPFNYLNEVMNGLSAYLKEWADMPIKGGPRGTPMDPGSPDSPDTPPSGPDFDPHGPHAGKTMGDLAAAHLAGMLSERYNNALLQELSMMDDPKSKALYTLMDEWKTQSTDPTLESNPEKKGALLAKRKQVVAQYEQMIPFIVKHARERGNLNVDAAMQQAPNGDQIKQGIDEQIRRINVGLTPAGEEITGQTSPDVTQLFDLLEGDKAGHKSDNFNQTYERLDSNIQNNALARAIKKIVDTPRLSKEERQKQFQELMNGDTIWTPEDIAATNSLFSKLQDDGHISAMPPQVEIKPYGRKAKGHEMDVVDVHRNHVEEIEDGLATYEEEGRMKKKMRIHDEDGTSIAEMVDPVSGSITLRVAEEGQKPWFLTYCEAQQKVVIMDRDKKMSNLNLKDATPELQGTCAQLADHFTLIMNGRSPFKEGMSLKDTFSTLVGSGRVKAPHEVDGGRP